MLSREPMPDAGRVAHIAGTGIRNGYEVFEASGQPADRGRLDSTTDAGVVRQVAEETGNLRKSVIVEDRHPLPARATRRLREIEVECPRAREPRSAGERIAGLEQREAG